MPGRTSGGGDRGSRPRRRRRSVSWRQLGAAVVVTMLAVSWPATVGAQDPTTTTTSSTTTTEATSTTTTEATTTTTTAHGTATHVATPGSDRAGRPDAGRDQSVITVKVGGDRSGASAVDPQAGVTLQLFDNCTTADPDHVRHAQHLCLRRRRRLQLDDQQHRPPAVAQPGSTVLRPPDRPAAGRTPHQPPAQRRDSTARGPRPTTSSRPAPAPGRPDLQLAAADAGSTGSCTARAAATNASGGIWQTSRTNPTLPARCGLRVALDPRPVRLGRRRHRQPAHGGDDVRELPGRHPVLGRPVHLRLERPGQRHEQPEPARHLGVDHRRRHHRERLDQRHHRPDRHAPVHELGPGAEPGHREQRRPSTSRWSSPTATRPPTASRPPRRPTDAPGSARSRTASSRPTA